MSESARRKSAQPTEVEDEGGQAPNRYFDRNLGMQAAKILPGEYYATKRDMVVVTVLGSCVAACIRDPAAAVGGMNHFMLPDTGREGDDPVGAPARYGTFAMELLINELVKLGARRGHLEAKVFGGGNVLRNFTVNHVGTRNAEFVLKFLATERIPVLAKDLGDTCPRKVYYFPQTGVVRVRRLMKLHNATILERERDYGQRLSGTQVGGDVELFG